MVLLQSPKSINWDLFVRKGRLSQRTYRQLKQHLRKDCYDEQQIFSQVFLTNYLRQLRNLVFDQITPSIKAMWLAHPTDHHLEISQTVQNTYKNLDNLLPYPQLSNLTCSLPSKDSLWDISETKHSIVFTFQPIVHQRFQFRLLKSKLRHHHSELHTYSFSSIFKLVPTLQYASKGVTLNQPISVSATPISSASSRIMGIDLGLKTLATCSIGTDATEVGRTFITPKNLFSTRIDPQSGRTIPRTTQIQSQGNIWRRLYNLRRSVWKTQQQKDRVSNPERVQKFHNLLTRIWRNILHLHQEIRNQIVHKLVTLARAFQVRIIKFEDLRWSRARSKRKQGMWLTHHQLHWFHGEIIRHTIQMAARFGIRVVRVNAYLSSQLDADQVLLTGVGRVIPSKTSRAQFQDILGFRRGKQFWGIIDSSGRRKRIDADLNAARNIRLRTPIL